jgi:hypothetical protein
MEGDMKTPDEYGCDGRCKALSIPIISIAFCHRAFADGIRRPGVQLDNFIY